MIRTPGGKEERALQNRYSRWPAGLEPGGRRFKFGSCQLLAYHANFNGASARSIDQSMVGATRRFKRWCRTRRLLGPVTG